ncbi:Hsp70 protein-domain-containing protein [Kockovaella imperatae]|uniref:Hsp70 protein-domain-containing protein n=1 Tax=Kockovaella imperatae TaxID=4999 RepID=A0A1Y1U621_9TREE|nr:Hsp70 protein-domain-containing protein [Kockovaella imperatae]ORX33442.1 Hsp70 protein-domain-containing protein [Kockovaella imperatae]
MRIQSLISLCLILLAPAIHAAILAIDYGAEFTKLSLVKPGVPFDVILDRDSKRKIQSVVGWKRDDRVFGQEGKMTATRFPDAHFPYIKPLIGANALTSLPIYPSSPKLTSDGALIFPHPNHPSHISPAPESQDSVWTPTALLAHQISYFRGLAQEMSASDTVSQAVVTVPAWWNHYQRKAYKDALELQGLTCLAMIGEGTGVALNYAMTRTFPDFDLSTGQGEKEYHVIYDSGSLSTTATVVAFYQTSELLTPKSKTPIATTHIDTIGTGYSPVGGLLLDLTLQELLVEDFIKKAGSKADGIKEDKRAMAKIMKEAVRVKHILSANQESNVNVESLYNDIDFRSKISRAELESTLADSADLFASPVAAALSSAGINMSSVNSVILFGGNTRVPLVQSALKAALDPSDQDKIAQNVNTDEAAVLGAAYYAAALSKVFKMKKIDVQETSFEEYLMNGQVLFPKGSRLGEKKALSLDPKGIMEFDFSQGARPVLHLEILELEQALANFTSPEPAVNLTIRLDSRGYLATSNAVLVSNLTEPEVSGGVAGALKGLFGSKKDKDETGNEDENVEEGEDAVTKEAEDGSTPEQSEKKSKKAKLEKVALKFREKQLGIRPMTGEEKRVTMARLTSIAAYEKAKFAREEARNLLEGYLYRLSGLLSPDAENRALWEYGTQKEREGLQKLMEETFEWLGDHAEKAEEKTLVEKRSTLTKLEQPIITRFKEAQTRGKAIEDFQQAMFAARAFFVEAHKNVTAAKEAAEAATPENPVAPPKYTDEELKTVEDMLKDNEVWMDTRMQKQVKIETDKTKDPEILTEDLDSRGKRLQSTVLRLEKKKAPRAPKPVKSSSASSSKVTGEEDAESTILASPTETASSETAIPTIDTPIHEEL